MLRALLVAIACVGSLCGCVRDSEEEATGGNLEERVDRLGAVHGVQDVIPMTKKNDPEGLLDEPGAYVDGAVVHDRRMRCPQPGIDCGVIIEEWDDTGAMQDWSDYVRALQGSGVPGLGTEHHSSDEGFLLRINGDLPSGQIKAYKAAFEG